MSDIAESSVSNIFRFTKQDLHEIAQKVVEKAIKKTKAVAEYIFT